MTGAFCGRCGARASVVVRTEAPQPPPRRSQVLREAQTASTPPAGQERREAVWIFAVAGGLAVLGMVGTVVAVQRLKKAGVDLDHLWNNQRLGLEKVTAIDRPDVDLLSTNNRDGSITFRNSKTGTVGTITFEDGGHGDSVVTHREDGRTISHYTGRYAAARLPSWVPAYPRASAEGGSAAITWGDDGETGAFAFSTPDPAWKVQSFYEGKAREMNMQVEAEVRQFTAQIELTDAATHQTIAVTVVRKEPAWVSVSYASK